MSLIAPIKDGKIQETSSESSLKKAKKSSESGMDKDAFLQLLVAQMKYQDPLEPTSNTEFVSQYAQFSQVEQLQNMAGSMD
ncbi:MAG: flagellar hook capping protein, partial [Acetatifactor sp.]|nr:flagellar hook capping protein [Acetatifactor sp.]